MDKFMCHGKKERRRRIIIIIRRNRAKTISLQTLFYGSNDIFQYFYFDFALLMFAV
jgi:hypothetical protein